MNIAKNKMMEMSDPCSQSGKRQYKEKQDGRLKGKRRISRASIAGPETNVVLHVASTVFSVNFESFHGVLQLPDEFVLANKKWKTILNYLQPFLGPCINSKEGIIYLRMQ